MFAVIPGSSQKVAEFGVAVAGIIDMIDAILVWIIIAAWQGKSHSACVSGLKEVLVCNSIQSKFILDTRCKHRPSEGLCCKSTLLIVCACATICLAKTQIQYTSFKFIRFCYIFTTFAGKNMGFSC